MSTETCIFVYLVKQVSLLHGKHTAQLITLLHLHPTVLKQNTGIPCLPQKMLSQVFY